MKPNLRSLLGVVLVTLAVASPLRAVDTNIFSFAGFSFNHLYAANKGTLLGNSTNLGGATFSAGVPTEANALPLRFPQPETGFDSSKTLGRMFNGPNFGSSGSRAVSLPNGNVGTSTRHGVEVTWTNNVALPNLSGTDFVIYESGSSSNAVEGVMVRVRYETNPEAWTPWYYYPPVSYQVTTNAEVAFAYAYDVSNMGVPADKLVDRIELANLVNNDRIETTITNVYSGNVVGQGLVGFNQQTTNNIRPDAGSYNLNNHVFNSSSELDPDPIYVAILHQPCETIVPTLTVKALGGGNIQVTWPWPTCYLLESATDLQGPGSTVWTLETNVTISATLNTAAVSTTGGARYFRLSK